MGRYPGQMWSSQGCVRRDHAAVSTQPCGADRRRTAGLSVPAPAHGWTVGASRVTALLKSAGLQDAGTRGAGRRALLRRQEQDTEQDAARASGE